MESPLIQMSRLGECGLLIQSDGLLSLDVQGRYALDLQCREIQGVNEPVLGMHSLLLCLEGTLSLVSLSAAAIGTSRTVSMLGLTIAAASFLSVAMGFLGMPQAIEAHITNLDLSPLTLILLLVVIYIILGAFSRACRSS